MIELMVVLVIMQCRCIVEADRSRVLSTVTHTTTINHRIVSSDTSQQIETDSQLNIEQGDSLGVVKHEQCMDIPPLGLLVGNVYIN